ncbi:MAG: hypothetical protein Q7U04_05960 [Bacteriovorax sp.]|nr:hypothetical protein [Bacteriovorax sp.]
MKMLLILGILFPLTSFAIGTRGGGNARVCFTNEAAAKAARLKPLQRSAYWSSIDSIEVLDLYEAKLPRGDEGLSPVIMSAKEGESPKAYVERVAKRFDVTFPSFADIIREGRDTFSQSQIIWSAEPFDKTDDIDPALQYENKLCSILGLAFQKEVNGQTKIFIDQQLFLHPKHSLLSRDITFLHEYIYNYGRTYSDQTTSAPTREAVGLAISILPSNINKDRADDWGLSIDAISSTLGASGFLTSLNISSTRSTYSNLYDTEDTAALDMILAMNIEKDFVQFQTLLANTEEAQSFLTRIHDIVFVRGGYSKTYGPLLGLDSGVCRKGVATETEQIILGACLAVTQNENDEFVTNPSLKNELRKLDVELDNFLQERALIIAKESILPQVFKSVEERFNKFNISKSDIQKYKNALADNLLQNMKIRYDSDRYFDLTSSSARDFIRSFSLKEVISVINKRTADAPTK